MISSYLNVGPANQSALTSLTGVVGRNVSIMVANNEVNSLKNSDIVVSSDVSKIGTLDFEKNEEIIPLGYKAAELEAKEMEKYALNDADWAAYLAQRQARRKTDVPIPRFVTVYGVGACSRAISTCDFRSTSVSQWIRINSKRPSRSCRVQDFIQRSATT